MADSPTTERRPAPDLSVLRIDEHARGKRERSGWRAVGGAIVALSLASAGLFVFFRERPATVEVAAARADSGGPPTLLTASGYVTPRRRATVAAKITARVEEIYAEEGMRVKAGQILARLDDLDARARLNSVVADRDAAAAALGDLQVNLANAERELKRTEELWQRKFVADQARDQVRTAVEILRARLQLAREQVDAQDARVRVARQDLENHTVRAPFAGVIVSKDAQRGEMVSPVSAGGGFTRTGIATIVDMGSLEIEVDVNESYIARVKVGQAVTASLDAYPDWPIPGKVRTVIPTADRQKATVKVRVTFDRLDPRILPDMGVKVTFLGEAPDSRVADAGRVLVPHAAVRRENGAAAVFVYRDGRLERRAIRLGEKRDEDQEVLAGLSPGEEVVAANVKDLRDGQRARLRR
jgi:RND family efflux transporter MFP subunit